MKKFCKVCLDDTEHENNKCLGSEHKKLLQDQKIRTSNKSSKDRDLSGWANIIMKK